MPFGAATRTSQRRRDVPELPTRATCITRCAGSGPCRPGRSGRALRSHA